MLLICEPEMGEKKQTVKREFTGQRISGDLLARIEAIAKKQRSSPRAVMEQLFEKGLPELERFFGIEPEKPQK